MAFQLTGFEIDDDCPLKENTCATCKHSEYVAYYDGWHFDCHKHDKNVEWHETCDQYESNLTETSP